jgi:hypothetical protein
MAEFVLKVAAETMNGPLQRCERLRQRMARSGGGSDNITWRPALVAAIMQMPRGLVLSLTSMA